MNFRDDGDDWGGWLADRDAALIDSNNRLIDAEIETYRHRKTAGAFRAPGVASGAGAPPFSPGACSPESDPTDPAMFGPERRPDAAWRALITEHIFPALEAPVTPWLDSVARTLTASGTPCDVTDLMELYAEWQEREDDFEARVVALLHGADRRAS